MKMNSAIFYVMIGICMLFSLKELTFTIPFLVHEITLHLPRLIGIFIVAFGMDTAIRHGPRSMAAELSAIIIVFLGGVMDSLNEWPSNIYLRILILGVHIIIFWLFMVFMGEVAKSRHLSSMTNWQRRSAVLQLCVYGLVILLINLFQHLISPTYSPGLFLLTQVPLLRISDTVFFVHDNIHKKKYYSFISIINKFLACFRY